MVSPNYAPQHANPCPAYGGRGGDCTCGLDALLASAQVHAEQQERLAKHLSADEQRFWDAAFCAALTGMAKEIDWPLVQDLANGIRGGKPMCDAAAQIANTALAARQQRGK